MKIGEENNNRKKKKKPYIFHDFLCNPKHCGGNSVHIYNYYAGFLLAGLELL